MHKENSKQAYEALADGYNQRIDNKPHNAYYDRPNTLALLPDLTGKTVFDAACGPGKYAEILAAKGASITGCDISPKMVAHAQQRTQGVGHFFEHDLRLPIPQLKEASFDVVLCALAMHYIEDWEPTIKEFYRLLKPKGCLVLSIEHPFFEYTYFSSQKYFATEPVQCTWKGFGKPVVVPSYRRPLHACISPLTKHGFYIDQLVEPKPIAAFEAVDPKHYKELNEFPAFMCIKAVKK